MESLSNFQRKAILLIFISILVGAVLLARKEPLKNTGVVELHTVTPTQQVIPQQPLPTKIDINTADISIIMQLPGIGPSLAKDIIKYRPYSTIEDLLRVPGIGEKRLARIREMIDLPLTLPSPTIGVGEGKGEGDKSEVQPRTQTPIYDSRIDPKVRCPHCGRQLWEKGSRKQRYIRCPHCLKLL